MFYSHEVLTSRQYGVATVWLVATLGAKSMLKKVNRKAILEVNVPKACETIISPEAPMALRLQSNLLYGVVRVYGEQCSYVLLDAQNAQNNMRALFRTVKLLETDGKHKARSDQLNLRDDTQFVLDHLLNFDIDPLLDLDSTSTTDLDSLLSPHRSLTSGLGSEHADLSMAGIVIPPSVSSSVMGARGVHFGGSTHTGSGQGSRFGSSMFRREEDEHIFDPGFAFDEMGNIIDSNIDDAEGDLSQQELPTHRHPSALSEDLAPEVSLQKAEARLSRYDDNDGLPPAQDNDTYVVADAFPVRPGHLGQHRSSSMRGNSAEGELAELVEPASDAAAAAEAVTATASRVRKKKGLRSDARQELHSWELSEWSNNYLDLMQDVFHSKLQSRSGALAKRNADFWIFQNGIGGLGAAFRKEAIPEPLRIFTGHALIEALTGVRLHAAGEKRLREDGEQVDENVDENGRRVRLRAGEQDLGTHDGDVAMNDAGYTADDTVQTVEDETVEVGRDVQTPLVEHMSSIMPWNNTASIRGSSARPLSRAPFSARGFGTSSVGGQPNDGAGGMSSRMGSRMISTSPSGRRDDARAGLERFDDDPAPGLDFGTGADQDNHNEYQAGTVLDHDEQFEIFGPAANVETQQANHPSWVRQALDTESINFLAFVQSSIQDADVNRDAALTTRPDNARTDADDVDQRGSILFGTLLSPVQNNRIVAAQGLLHVLTLATKKMIHAGQEVSFGPIDLRVPQALVFPAPLPLPTD